MLTIVSTETACRRRSASVTKESKVVFLFPPSRHFALQRSSLFRREATVACSIRLRKARSRLAAGFSPLSALLRKPLKGEFDEEETTATATTMTTTTTKPPPSRCDALSYHRQYAPEVLAGVVTIDRSFPRRFFLSSEGDGNRDEQNQMRFFNEGASNGPLRLSFIFKTDRTPFPSIFTTA
jgi:hypothetical protein